MQNQIINETKRKMEKAIIVLKNEFKVIRTGRPSPALIENLQVMYYGVPTPLKQLSNISSPDPQMLVIKPFDTSALSEIEKAIQKSDLGINPNSDGKIVRLNFPPLSEERRKQITILAKSTTEKTRVTLRNIRRESNKLIDEAEKEGLITEDIKFKTKDKIQDMISTFEKDVDKILENKTKEIMEG